MQTGQHPDAIDTRLVLRIYAWVVTAIGLAFMDGFPFFMTHAETDYHLPGLPWGRVGVMRVTACAVAALGLTAVGLSRIESPVDRSRALTWFAIAHLGPGLAFFGASSGIFGSFLPPALPWIPLAVGVVLLYVALTSAHVPKFTRPFISLFSDERVGPVLVERSRPGTMQALRSQYEEQVRQAARLEERSRLARDLHDAVKQQLFAIQTSAATAQARFSTDTSGAQAALEQVRASARDAMTEMEALIGQLQAPPMENTGLVDALRQQCDALALRTGAEVTFDAGPLPPSAALPPGAQPALFRAAQEALANVARHARATHVKVRLSLTGDNLELMIRDDGAGFDPMTVKAGMGTASMKARVCEVSGRFLLQSAPARGTTVAFSVPCDTSTPRDYGRRALLWSAVLVATITSATFENGWDRPWHVVLSLIVAITVARYVVAWSRVRHRREAVA
jgi:signal transduction histidine kinase